MNKRWLLVSGLFVLFCWFIISGINRFPYPAQGEYSDFTISHYPNVLFTQHAIHTWHQLPLWNNTILSGNPYAADPLASIWYPPYWLAIPLPQPFGLNLLTILHLVCGAVGMMKFLQALGIKIFPAVTGSIVFLLMPKLFAHIGAGHLTLVWAVSLTPWLLYFEKRSQQSYLLDKRKMGTVFIAAGIVLADVRWAAIAWVLWVCFALWEYKQSGQDGKKPGIIHILIIAWLKFRQGLLASLLASQLLLPLIQFIHYSTRNVLQPQDSLILSLPPAQLIGLMFPNFGSSAEWTVYFGALPMLMLIVILTNRAYRRKASFWLFVFVFSLVISLGSALPGAEFLAALPGFSLLRVPPRVLLLAGISLAVLTGLGLQSLSEREIEVEQPAMRLGLVGYISLVSIFAIVFGTAGEPAGFLWGGGLTLITGIALLLLVSKKLKNRVWLIMLICLLIIDLNISSISMLRFRDESSVLLESKQFVTAIRASQDIPGRCYSSSYSLPQEVAAKYELRLADGINPLQLAAYTEYMQHATGVTSDTYSVTMPAYKTGNPEIDNILSEPNPVLLGYLNVPTVISAYALNVDGLQLQTQSGSTFIYSNIKARPAAWVQSGLVLDENESVHTATIVLYSPNKVVIQASGPGVLILADPMYPGWKASVDGNSAEIETVGGLLRGISLPAGNHTIKFFFRPILVYLGCALQIIVLLGLLVSNLYKKQKTARLFYKDVSNGGNV